MTCTCGTSGCLTVTGVLSSTAACVVGVGGTGGAGRRADVVGVMLADEDADSVAIVGVLLALLLV